MPSINGIFTENHVIDVVSKDVVSRKQAAELSYDDFKIILYIDGKYIADLSHVLSKCKSAWHELIDATNWEELFSEQNHELKNQREQD